MNKKRASLVLFIALLTLANISATAQEEPRPLRKEDGIQFAIHGGLFQIGPSHLPHGQFANFGLVDLNGSFIPLEVSSQSFYNGVIQTAMFGNVILTSTDPDVYAVTESQIKKIHSFLLARAHSSPKPSK